VPAKTLDYAKYDLVRVLNKGLDTLGLRGSIVERVVAEHAEGHRGAGLLEGMGRPPNELREIIQEGRFDLILAGWRVLPGREPCAECEKASEEAYPESRPVRQSCRL